jgi:hypothetical protein
MATAPSLPRWGVGAQEAPSKATRPTTRWRLVAVIPGLGGNPLRQVDQRAS